MKIKKCYNREKVKDRNEFYKNSRRKDGLDTCCKECRKDIHRNGNLQRYGISIRQYEYLRKVQDNKCAICDQELNDQNFHVDHDHKSGIIRGLLCPSCNVGLGHYESKKKLFEQYLKTAPERMVRVYKYWLNM
jgi:hypothetical protein